MLDLHRKQLRGEIQSDVILNINEDADLETWLPTIKWMPNMGGLEEFIQVVNKYEWADFALPSDYLAGHAPKGEVIVRQDLAVGGFDGNYSWAEKCSSLRAWTMLVQSRLASYRADALAGRAGLELNSLLWEGKDSSFFQRLIGLTTTHFGMSTPIINEERQDKAFEILGTARRLAEEAEQLAARALRKPPSDLYDLELYLTPPGRDLAPLPVRAPVNLPVVLPSGVDAVWAEDDLGRRIRASLTDLDLLPDGRTASRIRFEADLKPGVPLGLAGKAVSSVPGDIDLHVEALEHSPYTTILRLTYFFEDSDATVADPDLEVRVYHDARLAEASRCSRWVRHPGLAGLQAGLPTALGERWLRNMLLNKWLDYCSERGHRVDVARREPPASHERR